MLEELTAIFSSSSCIWCQCSSFSWLFQLLGLQFCSIQNWIEDLFWKQLDLNYPEMPDAMVGAIIFVDLILLNSEVFTHQYILLLFWKVHHGFYSAYHNTSLRPAILNAVQRIMDLYGDIRVMVTGHSMGGAMASFCALDLTVSIFSRDIATIHNVITLFYFLFNLNILCFCISCTTVEKNEVVLLVGNPF